MNTTEDIERLDQETEFLKNKAAFIEVDNTQLESGLQDILRYVLTEIAKRSKAELAEFDLYRADQESFSYRDPVADSETWPVVDSRIEDRRAPESPESENF